MSVVLCDLFRSHYDSEHSEKVSKCPLCTKEEARHDVSSSDLVMTDRTEEHADKERPINKEQTAGTTEACYLRLHFWSIACQLKSETSRQTLPCSVCLISSLQKTITLISLRSRLIFSLHNLFYLWSYLWLVKLKLENANVFVKRRKNLNPNSSCLAYRSLKY